MYRTIGFAGGGIITRIFINRLKQSSDMEIRVSDPDVNVLSRLKSQFQEIKIFKTTMQF